jgi:hypothetical protein
MNENVNAGHREEDPDDLAIVVNRIELLDYLNTEGERILFCSAEDADGNRAPLIDVLGALRLGEDTFIRQYMGETPDAEEDDDDEQA